MGKLLIKLLGEARGNALWDGIKWAWSKRNLGAALVTFIISSGAAWLKGLSLPWFILVVLLSMGENWGLVGFVHCIAAPSDCDVLLIAQVGTEIIVNGKISKIDWSLCVLEDCKFEIPKTP